MSDNTTMLRNIIIVIVIVIAGVAVVKAVKLQDDRTAVERAADAVKALPNGVDAAQKELEDRTPVEQMGNKLKEITK